MEYHKILSEIILKAKEELKMISDEEFSFKSLPNKWSKKEILGHLIDSAYNNHRRFMLASEQTDLVFDGYKQEEWVVKNQYQNRTKEELIEAWYLSNQHLVYLIEGIDTELLNRKTTHHNFHKICMNLLQEGEEISLSYLIWDYIFHLEHHLGQMIEGYERSMKGNHLN